MKISHNIITFGLLASTALLPQASNAVVNVTVGHKPGLCVFTIPAGNVPEMDEKPMKLEIAYRVSDGATSWSFLVNGWPKAQAADPDYDFPLMLEFDTGAKVSSQSGGYSSGFNDKLWGMWNAGEHSDTLLISLESASSVQITADSLNLGTIDLQGEGFIYRMIEVCVQKKRANGE